jgi:hypothetical protein
LASIISNNIFDKAVNFDDFHGLFSSKQKWRQLKGAVINDSHINIDYVPLQTGSHVHHEFPI